MFWKLCFLFLILVGKVRAVTMKEDQERNSCSGIIAYTRKTSEQGGGGRVWQTR